MTDFALAGAAAFAGARAAGSSAAAAEKSPSAAARPAAHWIPRRSASRRVVPVGSSGPWEGFMVGILGRSGASMPVQEFGLLIRAQARSTASVCAASGERTYAATFFFSSAIGGRERIVR